MFLKTDTMTSNAHYASVPTISRQRNSFSIAERHITTIQFDNLYPMFWRYTYPGDTFNIQHLMMARLQTQISDLFDDLYFDLHAWFVPFRLLQTNWSRFQFNTQTAPGQDNTSLTTPKIDLTTLTSGFPDKSLYDYLGFPTNTSTLAASTEHINNYLGRAYNLIWNTNYRDENFKNPVVVDLDDGPDLPSDYVLLPRGKRHDKFTSALPFLQKGTAPGVPILGSAPVLGIGKFDSTFSLTNVATRESDSTTSIYANAAPFDGNTTAGGTFIVEKKTTDGFPNIRADLSAGLAYMFINDLRLTASVQHLLEGDARGGTRDVESILHRWGVQVPDFRMQRPEYLGGQTFTFDGHVVPATAGYNDGTTDQPQAHLTSFSQAMNSFNFTHSMVEHGVMMILLSARSNLTYQQGLKRELSYQTRFDFYQPEFAHLGEVAMKSKEIQMTGTSATDNAVFGYQEYGYELRYGENRVTAEMRSDYPQSLDYKHMAIDFGPTPPALNGPFINSFTPIDRNIVVASGTSDPIQINSMVKGTMARTLPMFSVPGIKTL